MNPHRVLWVLDSLQPGGAERLALRFLKLAPPPWQIELVALQPPPNGVALEVLWGRELETVAGGVHQLGMRSLHDLASWRQLAALVRRWQPAVIHTHLRYATIWGAAARGRVPQVVTVHLGPASETGPAQKAAAWLERRARCRAARVLYVSQAQRQAWSAAFPRRVERALVLGNGVGVFAPELSQAAARRALALPPAAAVALTVAVVRAAKGWRVWLEAVERLAPAHPQALFVWVGGGPDHPAFAQAVAASRWRARIRLAGPQADVGPWLRAADAFLFPSLEEAQPTAVMEAMAAGLPVVATALPAIAEVAGPCARLVPPGNAAALAHAAAGWLHRDAAEARQALGRAAAARAQACFSEAAWCERLLEVYAELSTAPTVGRACAA